MTVFAWIGCRFGGREPRVLVVRQHGTTAQTGRGAGRMDQARETALRTRVELGILGPLVAHLDSEDVNLGGRRQRAVVAILLLARGRQVGAGRLLDALWEDAPPPSGPASLQSYVSHLRRALEPDRPARTPSSLIVTSGDGYAIPRDQVGVDAWRFEDLLDQASDADPASRVRLLREGLDLWRGPVLAEYAGAELGRRRGAPARGAPRRRPGAAAAGTPRRRRVRDRRARGRGAGRRGTVARGAVAAAGAGAVPLPPAGRCPRHAAARARHAGRRARRRPGPGTARARAAGPRPVPHPGRTGRPRRRTRHGGAVSSHRSATALLGRTSSTARTRRRACEAACARHSTDTPDSQSSKVRRGSARRGCSSWSAPRLAPPVRPC